MTQRILLADDHRMFREALRGLLERQAGFVVVGETGDGSAVLPLARESSPDIVCMDIEMPGPGGIEATRQLLAEFPAIRVVALSTYTDGRYVRDMLAAGAKAYVTKTEAGNELIRAIDAVLRGRAYLCPDAAEAIHEAVGDEPTVRLGKRELEVLRLVAQGLTSARIAEQLNIAQSTVEVHRRNIQRKLNTDGAVGMTRYAIKHKLIGP